MILFIVKDIYRLNVGILCDFFFVEYVFIIWRENYEVILWYIDNVVI